MSTVHVIARWLYLGYTPTEIALHLDHNRRHVFALISKHRLPSNYLPADQARRLLKCLVEGGDLHELCAVFSVTPALISRRLVCNTHSPLVSSRLLWLAWWQPVSTGPSVYDRDGSD